MLRILPSLLALTLTACGPRSAATSEAPPAPAAASPSDADLATLVRRLQVYHPATDCTALSEGLLDARATFVRAVEEVRSPPWVALISGSCLAREHAAAEEARLTAWLQDDEMRGLARVLIRDLPDVPDEAVALRIASAALASPHADYAAEILRTDPRPALAALAPPAPSEPVSP